MSAREGIGREENVVVPRGCDKRTTGKEQTLVLSQPSFHEFKLFFDLRSAHLGMKQERWGQVLELRVLQSLAFQQRHDEQEALDALAEAVRLGDREGYLRSFLDEGAPMASLLLQLRDRERQQGQRTTSYLDTLLAHFHQEEKADQSSTRHRPPGLLEPLTHREEEVLHLLAQGASNQEIADALVIVADTAKRHVGSILSKLGVGNRTQAVLRAHSLGLLSEE